METTRSVRTSRGASRIKISSAKSWSDSYGCPMGSTSVRSITMSVTYLYLIHRSIPVEVALRFRQQLEEVLDAIAQSALFPNYEIIGSSLLFMHCGANAAIRWIDFANTIEKPCGDENGIRKGIENLKIVFDQLIQKHCN